MTAVFPDDLPGLKWDIERTQVWSTKSVESVSGRRFAQAMWATPRRKYSLAYSILRETQGHDEMRRLVGFFNARRGAFEPFFFFDPEDGTAANAACGVGDGARVRFQLARPFGGVSEPVYGVKRLDFVSVDGVTLAPSEYTISSSGELTLNRPPDYGVAVRWSGLFYQLVRFSDELATTEFAHRLFSARRVQFETVKP